MKKSALFILVLVIITVFLSSCMAAFPSKEKVVTLTNEEATKLMKDMTEKETHDHWGDPDDTLSGFNGDVYVYNNKSIVIYYDADSTVTDVCVFDE